MTVVQGTGQTLPTGRGLQGIQMFRKQAAFNCDQCKRMSIGEANDSAKTFGHDVEPYLEADNVRHWFPESATSREFPDIPEQIAQAATEATMCLSFAAYRAVGSLARAVIEATAKDKGMSAGGLVDKIDALEASAHIRPHTKEQAHEIRHFGNDMAHGDFVAPVIREEAEEVIELMREVLDEVYQSPARLEKRRNARIAKKAADQ
ncbi:hypothetical protein ACVW00_003730 [Marmoricola sp. URHA0025 HA25]